MDGFFFEEFKARNRQLSTEVKKLVLNVHQQVAHVLGHVFTQEHADVGVEFVHLAHGVYAQAVFRDALVVAQAGGASVAGAGGDLCESVAHVVCLVLFCV